MRVNEVFLVLLPEIHRLKYLVRLNFHPQHEHRCFTFMYDNRDVRAWGLWTPFERAWGGSFTRCKIIHARTDFYFSLFLLSSFLLFIFFCFSFLSFFVLLLFLLLLSLYIVFLLVYRALHISFEILYLRALSYYLTSLFAILYQIFLMIMNLFQRVFCLFLFSICPVYLPFFWSFLRYFLLCWLSVFVPRLNILKKTLNLISHYVFLP